jgi:hypothetical protein
VGADMAVVPKPMDTQPKSQLPALSLKPEEDHDKDAQLTACSLSSPQFSRPTIVGAHPDSLSVVRWVQLKADLPPQPGRTAATAGGHQLAHVRNDAAVRSSDPVTCLLLMPCRARQCSLPPTSEGRPHPQCCGRGLQIRFELRAVFARSSMERAVCATRGREDGSPKRSGRDERA